MRGFPAPMGLFVGARIVTPVFSSARELFWLQAVTFCRHREIPLVVDTGMFRFMPINLRLTRSTKGINMSRKLFSIVVISITTACLALASGAASAGANDNPAKGKMAKIDRDGDGKISREEAASFPRLAKHFDQIDSNKDGGLSRDELVTARKKAAAAKFKALDANGDSRISRAEADAKAPRLSKHFDQFDTNKDGYLSKDELVAAHKMAQARR